MEEQFIRDRLSRLREEKQISERKMSLDLGHSRSYMQGISSGRALPSMTEFLAICDYLEVTPKDFFDEGSVNPPLLQTLLDKLKTLSENDLLLLYSLAERLEK